MTQRPPPAHLALGLLVACALSSPAAAAPPGASDGARLRTQTVDLTGLMDANTIGMVVTNTGSFAYDMTQGAAGLEYPRGTGKTAVFAGGLWLAGMSNGSLRAAVTDYSSEYRPGAMVGGAPDDPSKAEYKVYKLHRFYPSAAERDAALADYDAGAVPHGAQAVLVLPDGSLDILGDQMLWSVQNDASAGAHTNPGGSTAPLGVEVRQTTFAYDSPGSLGSAVFLRFEITSRSPDGITDMHAGIWSDPDLGGYTDDLTGCDPARDLGYCYNATNNDLVYGTSPPAVGFDLLFGPVTSPGPGARSTAFIQYRNGTDPVGATQTYNHLQGLLADGSPIIDPTTSQVTRYYFTGDPVGQTGWLDSNPADRRMLLASGPFTLAPGETRALWVAIVIGQGSSRLASITALRLFDDQVQASFDGAIVGVPRPEPQRLELRVGPNPGTEFAVAFGLSRGGRVRATVHDLAGRRVAVVADGRFGAGPQLLHWDGRAPGAPSGSGLYWMRLETPDGVAVRKIVRLE